MMLYLFIIIIKKYVNVCEEHGYAIKKRNLVLLSKEYPDEGVPQ